MQVQVLVLPLGEKKQETHKEIFHAIFTVYYSLLCNHTAMGTSSSTAKGLSWFFEWYSRRVRSVYRKSGGIISVAHSISNESKASIITTTQEYQLLKSNRIQRD